MKECAEISRNIHNNEGLCIKRGERVRECIRYGGINWFRDILKRYHSSE